ncbi:hypothetical protein [Gordonia rubripertincta]|uniref:hypothetical protein n=1 Tax=Gordonia rubripertincta TaxID=36822 RepID=UPI000B8D4E0D|nr:hypothetical protein [Gordonia rubripertincta]ASR01968.1 hypothetical protein GCWB2_05755 [Gordonia rubripertincta]QMU22919.1 hypothetical protein H3V45_10855 [Gordonia rubripertincta]
MIADVNNADPANTAANASQTAASSSAADRSRDRGATPPPSEPAKVVYRYEYNDPYAPMSTRKQVLLGCAISVVVIAFMVAALVIGRG